MDQFVVEHIKRAVEAGEQWYRESIVAVLQFALEHCGLQSPLEKAFYAWWVVMDESQHTFGHLTLHPQEIVELEGHSFRLDFSVQSEDETLRVMSERYSVREPQIAIELDGHDFHERTKEQVTYRNRRDRALLTAGWSVLHVSGSEFHRDPVGCINAIRMDVKTLFRDARVRLIQLEYNAKTPDERAAYDDMMRSITAPVGAVDASR